MSKEGRVTNSYIVPQDDFQKAGLWDTTWYNFKFESVKPETRTVEKDNPKYGSKAGDKYDVIAVRMSATQKAQYNTEGDLDVLEDLDPQPPRFQDFSVQGNGLAMLKSAYRAVTGQEIAGHYNDSSGRYEVDLLSAAESLIGMTAWNSIYHSKPDGNGRIYDRLSYNFAKQPRQRVKV